MKTIPDAAISAIKTLLERADVAAQWMCDANEGTDQHERGALLDEAMRDVKAILKL